MKNAQLYFTQHGFIKFGSNIKSHRMQWCELLGLGWPNFFFKFCFKIVPNYGVLNMTTRYFFRLERLVVFVVVKVPKASASNVRNWCVFLPTFRLARHFIHFLSYYERAFICLDSGFLWKKCLKFLLNCVTREIRQFFFSWIWMGVLFFFVLMFFFLIFFSPARASWLRYITQFNVFR